jgi:hypothetical protein
VVAVAGVAAVAAVVVAAVVVAGVVAAAGVAVAAAAERGSEDAEHDRTQEWQSKLKETAMKTPNVKSRGSRGSMRRPARRQISWVVLVLAGFAACSSSAPSQDDGTGERAATLDEHHIPASQIAVPPPVVWIPRPVVEPANPIAHLQPMHNPGGVNGDRAPRQVLGLEHAAPAPQLRTQDVMPAPPVPGAAPARTTVADDARFAPSVAARMQRDFHRH